jgi:hypothetical protein
MTSWSRSSFSLRIRALFDIGLDKANALRRGFSGGRVCEGDFLDHTEVDELIQPCAKKTAFRFGRVFESLQFYEYAAKRRSSRNSQVLSLGLWQHVCGWGS